MFLHQRWIALALSLSICVCTAGTQTSDACGSPQYNVSTIHGLRSALSTGYDPLEAPYPPPIDVHVLLTIRNIYSIDTKAGAYWIDLTVTAKWFDCRLAYNDSGNPYLTFIAWDAPQVCRHFSCDLYAFPPSAVDNNDASGSFCSTNTDYWADYHPQQHGVSANGHCFATSPWWLTAKCHMLPAKCYRPMALQFCVPCLNQVRVPDRTVMRR